MKTLFHSPFAIYGAAALASLSIMTVVDFLLGPEAGYLSAWAIVNRLLGRDIGLEDSLAIRRLGLAGATAVMLIVNLAIGYGLVQLVRFTTHFLHS